MNSRYSKAWDINQLLNYERKKYNDQTQLNVMQHAMVLLVAFTTMRGTQLRSMKRSEIEFDYEGMNILVLKKKAKNRGQQFSSRRKDEESICPVKALSNQLDIVKMKFPTSQALWYNKWNIKASEQGVRDQLRARIRQTAQKTKLSVEQVNQLTDHAPGSVVIEQYYNKLEHPLGIDDIIGQSVPAALSDQTQPL
ncbi:MAG: hypothetical protein EZS28_010709 [Streblomastix strix]|uniref:Tyr recombinase domain-containing protein n=1 Tax=Streblomastix strix TaxID=222440 RepID=A0A5J4WGB5_9EUKA|nr:MAG: hypothetical protein EZS28_010709 [Streblomastix strix]